MATFRKTFLSALAAILLAAVVVATLTIYSPNVAEASSSSTKMKKYDIAVCTAQDSLRIRDSDRGGGEIIGKLRGGDYCFILKAGVNGFYYIRTRGGLQGYAHGSYLKKVDCEVVTASRKLPVLKKASKNSKLVATLAKGEKCWMRTNKNGWALIMTTKGVIGWTKARYLEE